MNDGLFPNQSSRSIPKWFNDAEMYVKDPNTGEKVDTYWNDQKMLTFKACPALIDAFAIGYIYKTPCDILFKNENNKIIIEIQNGYQDFCTSRGTDPQLHIPNGFYKEHFSWYPNWAPELPEGYSGIYITPLNHFELPFMTMAGIIDSDKMTMPGLVPFFLKEGFTGIIPKGTPYLQVIPFKREDWKADYEFYDNNQLLDRHQENAKVLRQSGNGIYKKRFWSNKKYR
jgi:hypothetical protein